MDIFIIMNKEQVLAIVRHTLTFIGGVLIVKGLVDESVAEQIISGVMTLTGLVWSVFDKNE
jgi:hypothetical protein